MTAGLRAGLPASALWGPPVLRTRREGPPGNRAAPGAWRTSAASFRAEVPEDDQLSALTASVCCIATRPHQWWQLSTKLRWRPRLRVTDRILETALAQPPWPWGVGVV